MGADDGVLGGHSSGSKSEAGGDDSGETLGDGGHSQGNSDLEVVDSSLDPGSSVSGVIEVTNVDGPDSNADEGDHLGQLLTKLVQLLLQGSLDLLGLSHLISDLTNSSTSGLASSNIGAGEDDVLLVLVDSSGVGDWVAVLDDGDRLSSEDGLINSECGGVDLDESEVSRNLVTH